MINLLLVLSKQGGGSRSHGSAGPRVSIWSAASLYCLFFNVITESQARFTLHLKQFCYSSIVGTYLEPPFSGLKSNGGRYVDPMHLSTFRANCAVTTIALYCIYCSYYNKSFLYIILSAFCILSIKRRQAARPPSEENLYPSYSVPLRPL